MLRVGVKNRKEIIVTEALLASSIGSGLVRVLATPMMIAGIEGCAAESVAALLDEGRTTVGTHIDISHEAATPLGMRVTYETELVEMDESGRRLRFRVAAYDENGLIGRGTHDRAVVNKAHFEQKAEEKRQGL